MSEAAADALAAASCGGLLAARRMATSPPRAPAADTPLGRERTEGAALQERWQQYSKRPLRRKLALQGAVARISFAVLRAKLTKNEQRASELRRAAGQRAVRELLRLGPTYVKLGQIASCRGDLIPSEYIDELKTLQDQVPAFGASRAKKTLEAEFGRPVHELLRSFDEKPLAAASLGQVHAAVTKEGQQVAIKVQRDGLKDMYDLDLADLGKVTKFLDRFNVGVAGAAQNWSQIFQDASVLLYREIDYTAEAQNSERCRENLEEQQKLKWLKIPAVVPALTSTKVLTMEFVPGIKISDVDALDKAPGVDRKVIASRLAHTYLLMFCKYGFFNTDPHPGNLAVDSACPGGRIIMYDFGQAAELEDGQCRGLLETIQAIVDLDAAACTQAFVKLGCLGPDANLKAIEHGIGKAFQKGMLRSKASKSLQPMALTDEKPDSSACVKDFKLPSSLAFAARAMTQLQGVGVLLNEDWEFIAEVAPRVPELQMQQGAGYGYLAHQGYMLVARRLAAYTDRVHALCARRSRMPRMGSAAVFLRGFAEA